ncbi:MAG: PAS domain S-box protein [Bacteroidota bacterium]|nr:PAS domain S-box protein [Bacteroidota bacterium]
MKIFKYNFFFYGMLITLFSALIYFTIDTYYKNEEMVSSQFQEKKLLQLDLRITVLRACLDARSQGLKMLASQPSIQNMSITDVEKDFDDMYAQLLGKGIESIWLLNSDGVITVSTNKQEMGKSYNDDPFFDWVSLPDIKDQIYIADFTQPVDSALENINSSASGQLRSYRFLMVIPLNKNRVHSNSEFSGAVLYVMNLKQVLISAFSSEYLDKDLKMWIMDSKGTLLFQPDHPEMVLRNINRRDEECKTCHESFDHLAHLLVDNKGTALYRLVDSPQKISVFKRFDYANISWVLVINEPYKSITSFSENNLLRIFILIVITILIFSLGSSKIYSYYRLKVKTEEKLKHIAEKEKLQTKLLKAKSLYSTVIETAHDLIFMLDTASNITFGNKSAETLIGYKLEELVGKSFITLIHRDDITYIRKIFTEVLDGNARSFETKILNKINEIFILSINAVPLLQDGQIVGIAGFGRDITTEKRNTERIVSLSRIYNVISKINEAIIRIKNCDDLFNEICNICVEIGQFKMAWIGIFDETVNAVKPAAFSGTENGYLAHIKITIDDTPEGLGPTGSVFKFLEHSVCNDIENDPRMLPWRDEALKRGYRSSAAFPICVRKKVFGTLNLYSENVNHFREEEIKLLSEVAADLSFSLDALESEKETRIKEAELIASEEKLAALFNTSVEGICITDIDENIIMVNPQMGKMLGYSTSELVNMNFSALIYEDQRKDFFTKMEDRKKGKSDIYEKKIIAKDGSIIWAAISASPIFNKNGEYEGSFGMFTDITEIKISAEKIAKSEHQFRSVWENSFDAMRLTDQEGVIIAVNNAFSKLFELPLNDLIGMPISLCYGEPSASYILGKYQSNFLDGNIKEKFETQITLWNGKIIWVELSNSFISPNVNKHYLLSIFRNITEKKNYVKELKSAKEKAEALEKIKSEFLAQMSHEIRTPLNIIMGNASLLKEEFSGNLNKNIVEILTSMDASSKRIFRTIDLILNMSELHTGVYTPILKVVDLDKDILLPLIQEMSQLAVEQNLQLIYMCIGENSVVLADDYCITQIFANLIDNAIKYTKKGHVKVLLNNNSTGDVIVEVIDTGIGMSDEFLQHLFEPFVQEEHGYSRSFDGNGLGLTLVKKYCELNNAVIQVESIKNVGSTFRIIFNK